MVIVWRLRGNITRTGLCWIVWHNVHSPQHTYMSSSYRFNRLGLSHWDPYAVHRCGCLELHCCNMIQWFYWDSSLISTTNWFPSVLGHCWFGHLTCKTSPKWPIMCWVGHETLHTHSLTTHTIKRAALLFDNNNNNKFACSFNRSEDISWGVKFKPWSSDPDHAPFRDG